MAEKSDVKGLLSQPEVRHVRALAKHRLHKDEDVQHPLESIGGPFATGRGCKFLTTSDWKRLERVSISHLTLAMEQDQFPKPRWLT